MMTTLCFRLTLALALALFLAACGGSGSDSNSGSSGGDGGGQNAVSNLEFTDVEGTATVEIMPDTPGDAVVLNSADAALIGQTLAEKPVAIIITGGDLAVQVKITSASDHLLTLETDGELLIDAGMSVGALEIIAGDYSIRAPVNLPAGNNLTLNTEPYTVITGLGEEGDESGETLQGINGNLAANYALGAAIDASSTASWNCSAPESCEGFEPLGSVGNGFSGHFNGLGHVVDLLSINRPLQEYVGLIGYLAPNASVRYAGVENANVTGFNDVGGLVGGIGESAVVRDSYSAASVSGDESVGGLVGTNLQGAVSHSHATGGVSGRRLVGGLVGENELGTVSDSYATGAVSGSEGATGGLVGYSKGRDVASGIEVVHVSDSYATGAVTGNINVGGLVGYSGFGNVMHSHATGAVSGSGGGNSVGGLMGFSQSNVYQCYAAGEVDGDRYVGGLVGYNREALVESYAIGAVSGDTEVGGLVGYNEYGNIIQGYATGAVTGIEIVGGLVGLQDGVVGPSGSSNASVYQSYATGQVTGGSHVGGLAGFNITGDFYASFWNTTANTAGLESIGTDNGLSNNITIIGTTLAELRLLATFTDAALGADAWDIDTDPDGDSLWLIEEGVTTPWIRAAK